MAEPEEIMEEEDEDDFLPYGLKFTRGELEMVIRWYQYSCGGPNQAGSVEEDNLAKELQEILNERI